MTMNKEWGGLIINTGCSNSCVFCASKKKASAKGLRKQLINVAKNLQDFKKQGIKNIEISGSDPIEYDHITELISYLKKEDYKHVQLSTHGTVLHNTVLAKKLVHSGIDRIRIPLYGPDAETHDAVTLTKGSFDATIKGINNLRSFSDALFIQIGSLILQQNKEKLIDIINLVQKLKINHFYFSVPCVYNEDFSYYVSIKELQKYALPLFLYSNKKKIQVDFEEIPYCVFKEIDDCIKNHPNIPDLGRHCQPPTAVKSHLKDIPSYRLKTKTNICKSCKADVFCDGFFVNDIRKFGTGNLKPLN